MKTVLFYSVTKTLLLLTYSYLLRLNVTTAVLCVVSSILEVVWQYGHLKDDHVVFTVMSAAYGMYLISNPFVYVITMGNLRGEYVELIRCSLRRLRGQHVANVAPS